MSERVIAIRVDEDLHRELKIKLASEGMTLKDYITDLIVNDLSPEDSDSQIAQVKELAEEIQRLSAKIISI